MFRRPPDQISEQEQQALFRQMLASSGPQPQPGGMPNKQQQGPETDDPIMQMMQQMMGGAGGGAFGQGGDFPAGLASMFGGQQAKETGRGDQYIWRIVHAVCAFAIAFYAVFALPFSGSQLARSASAGDSGLPTIFYMFMTTELVLQTSRYFMDQGKLPASGILATVGNFLPPPYSGYVRLISRYSAIWTTIVTDAMVIVFVLGFTAWLKGDLGAA